MESNVLCLGGEVRVGLGGVVNSCLGWGGFTWVVHDRDGWFYGVLDLYLVFGDDVCMPWPALA